MMRKRWTALTMVLARIPRRTRRLLIGFLCLLLTAPLHGFAERELLPEQLTVRVLHQQAPEPTPTAEPKPAPTPAPSPTPLPEEGNYSFLGHKTWKTPVDMADYYLGEMQEAAVCGDIQAGHAAECARNDAIRAGSEGAAVSFDDLLLLARVIDAMAGSDWLTEDFRLCVGEVVLNRVASPEFPNTLHDVVYQRGQYTVVNTARFQSAKPRQECVEAALRLLLGERRMVPAVVYQSDCIQGELFTMFPDRQLGSTYFCLSEHLELYP